MRLGNCTECTKSPKITRGKKAVLAACFILAFTAYNELQMNYTLPKDDSSWFALDLLNEWWTKTKQNQLSKKGKMVKNIMFAMGEGVLEIPEIPNPNSKIKQFLLL